MNIKPVHDNIVIEIEKVKKEEKTSSGFIIIPSQNNNNQQEIGTVVAVGEGRIMNDGSIKPSSVSAGNKVVFEKFAGTTISDDENMYLIIKENNILAIIN